MRLTADLLREAPAYINPLMQRELGLRGYQIQVIENLGATQDQYQAMDFSGNMIAKLDNFPQLKRLESLLMTNNRIVRIARGLGKNFPTLDSLILSHNKLSKLRDLDALSDLPKLTHLVLSGNPVCKNPDYRLYAIHRCPKLQILDFSKVKASEREAAKVKFGDLKAILEDEAKRSETIQEDEQAEAEGAKSDEEEADNTFEPGEGMVKRLTAEQRQEIMEQIQNASSMAEVERLEQLLKGGAAPVEKSAPMESDDMEA